MGEIFEIYSLEGEKFYIYRPGSTHYDENHFGNPVYKLDSYYLDQEFNKFIGNRNKNDIQKYASELKEAGKDVVIGPHSPEIEDQYGDFIPNENPNTLGIWERATEKDLEKYRKIIQKQQQEKVQKKLFYV